MVSVNSMVAFFWQLNIGIKDTNFGQVTPEKNLASQKVK